MKLADIKPAYYNPRKDLRPGDAEYDKMKRSIGEFDCVEPLVWNKRTQRLVGGHQRLKILLEKGIEEFEVSVVDLDDRKEKALNIALNKIQGEWDFTKMADLMTELDDGQFDLELTGFDMEEIRGIMEWYPEDGKVDEKEVDDLETGNKCPKCGYEW
jgi:ParB-like chromosome segregation protein Spo0J